ncbi:MAG: ATP phosphoribosyltransferase [bacterium]
MELRLGLPKGSLQDATFGLFKKAGYDFRVSARSYEPVVDDPEIKSLLMRPQEIPEYIQDGVIDLGLTGKDWIEDSGAQVCEVAELQYSKATLNPVRVVLAVHEDSEIHSVKDLTGKRVATEYVRLTERYLKSNEINAHVEFSWGACEVKVPQLVEAIVVNTETGSSLRAHNLRIVDTLLVSTTRLIANKDAWEDPWKRQKIESIAILLQGAMNAERLVGLKMNVLKSDLSEVIALLPALRNPTLSPLKDEDWVAVETIIETTVVRDLIPKLKRAGAEGIVEYPLNKVIY